MEKRDITYGGAKNPVEEFTLDELQEIAPQIDLYFVHMAKGEGKEGMAVAKSIIAKALRQDEAQVGASRTNMDELYAAVGDIAEIAGLKKLGERFRKEKEEREARAKAGTTSMPS